MNIAQKLLDTYPVISEQVNSQELKILLMHMEKTLLDDIAGDVVEFGCYEGTASLFIARMLHHHRSGKLFHVYDSFEGLPEKTDYDQSPAGEQFVQGTLKSSRQNFIKNFRKAALPIPIIHKKWFDEIIPEELPEEIAFAFLDGDFYESILQSLQLIEPRLAAGSCVIIDDYQSEALPGAAKAADNWLQKTHFNFHMQASLAIIHKP